MSWGKQGKKRKTVCSSAMQHRKVLRRYRVLRILPDLLCINSLKLDAVLLVE
jgi:hypothetical protein